MVPKIWNVTACWFGGKRPKTPFTLGNIVNGQRLETKEHLAIPDPVTGQTMAIVPDTSPEELAPFIAQLETASLNGLHNPIFNPERYWLLGEVCFKMATVLLMPENYNYFVRTISLVTAKDEEQARGELNLIIRFLQTFSGNNIRFLGQGRTIPGNRTGHEVVEYRWPFGPVAIISPFNFPLEILFLQLIGALAMGNGPVVIKPDQRVALAVQPFLELLFVCGLSKSDVSLLHAHGPTTEALLTARKKNGDFLVQMTQFTGSRAVAHRLSSLTAGRVKFEDSGLGWHLCGPNFKDSDVEKFAQQCDSDSHAFAKQKCSSGSLYFMHESWLNKGFYGFLAKLATDCNMSDGSLCPTLTWSNLRLVGHIKKMVDIGAKTLFGGDFEDLKKCESVPFYYGTLRPTAMEVSLDHLQSHFELVTTEVFAPFYLIAPWKTPEDLEKIINFLNDCPHHLTAAVNDRDEVFVSKVLAQTKPGTTYAGILAPTTGGPEWQHFGATGHPAHCGIGTPEDIIETWSQTRRIDYRRGD